MLVTVVVGEELSIRKSPSGFVPPFLSLVYFPSNMLLQTSFVVQNAIEGNNGFSYVNFVLFVHCRLHRGIFTAFEV